MEIGLAGVELGAGRKKQGDQIDPLVGLRIDALRGKHVTRGEALATVFHGAQGEPDKAVLERLSSAFTIGESAPEQAPVILERVG